MVRIPFCIAAVLISIAAPAGAWAATLDITPGAAQYGARVTLYAQYDATETTVPTVQKRLRAEKSPARVYLLRGFMNVFSLGMDDLAEKLQADGIAAMVTNHADAQSLLNQIVTDYAAGDRGPIILIGHSLGADAAIAMAEALDRSNIPVALVILFDGTAPHIVPKNVANAVNYTQQFDITPGVAFHGTLSNVDLRNDPGIDHLTIDKAPALQAQALNYALAAAVAPATAPPRRP